MSTKTNSSGKSTEYPQVGEFKISAKEKVGMEEFETVAKDMFFHGDIKIQDEVMILRLQKSLMMLEISSSLDFLQYIGHYVRVRLSEIKLYDTGIY